MILSTIKKLREKDFTFYKLHSCYFLHQLRILFSLSFPLLPTNSISISHGRQFLIVIPSTEANNHIALFISMRSMPPNKQELEIKTSNIYPPRMTAERLSRISARKSWRVALSRVQQTRYHLFIPFLDNPNAYNRHILNKLAPLTIKHP